MSATDNMNAKDTVEFLESLPSSGLTEFDTTSGSSIWVKASGAKYSIHGDCVRIEGKAGYGTITFADSILLIDPDTINYIRHSADLTK